MVCHVDYDEGVIVDGFPKALVDVEKRMKTGNYRCACTAKRFTDNSSKDFRETDAIKGPIVKLSERRVNQK